jgi:hypothetical protein
MFRLRWIIAMTVAAALGFGARADEQPKKEDLKAAIQTLANAVKQVVEEEKQEAVAIGDFTGPASLDSNFGPGLKNLLAHELGNQKVPVNRKANLSVKGRYAPITDEKDKKQMAVRLTVEVLDSREERRAEFKADVRDNTDIARMAGLTASLPANGTKRSRNEEIQNAREKPTVHVQGSVIKAKANSAFSVELLVGNQPRPASMKDGEAFVDIRRDEIYAVKVTNHSDREAAVTLTIDGLDVFSFSDDIDAETKRPKFSFYIVPPKSAILINGWHKTSDPKRSDNVLSFLVTEYGKGAASAAKSTGEVGVMTLTFAFAGEHPEDLPAEETKSAAGNETGFGPPRSEKFETVKRNIGVVRDVVTVRYTR